MANINNLNAAIASGKQAIANYKSTQLYATNADFKNAVDTLEKQLLDQEAYGKTIKESVLFESYINSKDYRLTEANLAIARRDFFKANWILSHMEESNETTRLYEKLYEQSYFNSIGRLFESCSDAEADFYCSHLSEKALFGSMASQIKKLTAQIKDVQSILGTLDEIQDYNAQTAEKQNTKLNAKRQDLENKTASFANSENEKEVAKRDKAVVKMNDITDKMGKNLEGSKANQSITNGKEALDKLKSVLDELNSYLSGDKLKKAITLVDRNTTLFGGAKVDNFITSRDIKIANMAKQIAKQSGVTDEEITAEDQEIAQEEAVINNEKEEAAPETTQNKVSKVEITKQALSSLPDGFTFEDYLNKCNELGASAGQTFDATNLAKAYSPTSQAVKELGFNFIKDENGQYHAFTPVDQDHSSEDFDIQRLYPNAAQNMNMNFIVPSMPNIPNMAGSSISRMVGNESYNMVRDSVLFESILYEGFFDKVKQGAQALGNKVKAGMQNVANNAKEYFANNTIDDLKQADVEEIRATFEELANKVAVFTTCVKEVQPIFNATGNSKFEVFNRKLGKALLTAGGIVRLAGTICPPLVGIGTAMAGAGAIANGIGNVRKDIATGHKAKAAVDVIGAIAGGAMAASGVGKALGKSGDILAKVSGAGKTLTGVKTTVNGIDKTKNASTAAGKGMGILSAMGGVAMTLSGLSALGVQFGGGAALSAEDATKLNQGESELNKGAQSIVNDEQVKELTAEKVALEQDPDLETEHVDLLSDTITRQVGNSNQEIAAAKVGDWIIRDDGTKIELKQFDIDYAKAAIGEIKPEVNPFDPENPMVGQITSKGHMITDKDLELLKPQGSTEVVPNVVSQVEEKLPEAPAAPIPEEVITTDLEPTDGVDELANSPEAVEKDFENDAEDTSNAKAADPELANELNDFDKNVKWGEFVGQPVQGEYRIDDVNIYGKRFVAYTFDKTTVCPIFNPKTGEMTFIERFDGKNFIKIGTVTGVPGNKMNLIMAQGLRNAGFKANWTANGWVITDPTGKPYPQGASLFM